MLVILCGPPGSGKTTLAIRLQRRLADHGYTFDLLHSDEYRRHAYDRMYEHVADTIESQSGADTHWILDGTFFKREWRNRFYQLGDVREVWVKASLETCLERNREREEPIPKAGVKDIYGQFEPPRSDLEIDTEQLDTGETLERLEAAVLRWLEEPAQPGKG